MSDQAAQTEELDADTQSALEALAGGEAEVAPEAVGEPEKAAETKPEVSPDPQTEKALKKGWKPLEEFEGDPDEWVDAAEFNRRQPLFEEIRKHRRHAQDLEKKLESTTKFVQGIEERVRKQTLAEIEAERRKAVEDGDVEAFEEADKKYQDAAKEPEAPKEEAQDEIPQEVQDFAARNKSWFEQNAAMTEDAVSFTKFYTGRGKPLPEALELAERDIKAKYPAFFKNPNQRRAQTVSAGTREQGGKAIGYNDLSAEQKAVFSAMKGTMTLDEYIKELKAQGEFND